MPIRWKWCCHSLRRGSLRWAGTRGLPSPVKPFTGFDSWGPFRAGRYFPSLPPPAFPIKSLSLLFLSWLQYHSHSLERAAASTSVIHPCWPVLISKRLYPSPVGKTAGTFHADRKCPRPPGNALLRISGSRLLVLPNLCDHILCRIPSTLCVCSTHFLSCS